MQGNGTNIGGIRESDEVASDFQKGSPLSSDFPTNHKGAPSGSTDSPSPSWSLTSLFEEADSEYRYQASSRSRSFLESPMKNGPLTDRMDADSRGLSSIPGGNYISRSQKGGPSDNDNVTCVTGSQKAIDLASWREILEHPTRGFHSSISSRESLTALQAASTGIVLGEEDLTRGQHLTGGSVLKEGVQNLEPMHSNWQTSFADNSVQLPTWPMDESSNLDLAYDLRMTIFEPTIHDMDLRNAPELFTTHPILQSEQNNHQIQFTNYEPIKTNSKTDMPIEGNSNYALTQQKSLLDGEESLKRVDSFSRWATKELGDVDDLHLQSLSGISSSTDECGNVVDDSSLSPSISQDQLFSILDSSPKCAYTDSETEGNRTNIGGIRESDEVASDFQKGSPLSSDFPTNHKGATSGNTDSPSPSWSLTSLFEEVDSEYSHQASLRSRSFLESPIQNGPLTDRMDADIQQILAEAQHRWLRPARICGILRNYNKFQIAPEPPNRPTSGSLFLFDRKVLRYFRKDGHNWRKKKDGKTVKEAHEKLKVGSVDVLHCYYAHGEENKKFQRRSYWLLEQDLMHIVLVHYLEVKGNSTNIGGIRESDEVASDFQEGSLLSSGFPTNHKGAPSGNTDSPSPIWSLASLFEETDSEYTYQASSRSRSFLESPMQNGTLTDRMDADIRRIQAEAQHRWLWPAEIIEILHNYKKFQIAPEPLNRPPSGSLFLFDRKVLRYFRKDGHNWRKKKDGKTVKEAHEKLKVGSVDVLHCYYAHGEENEKFQRRSYWLLEQDLMHIVLVHYLEVKGNSTNIGGIRESDEVASDFQKGSPLSSDFPTNHKGAPSGNTDSPSPSWSLTPLFEEVDSEYSYQASSRSLSFLESPMQNGPLMDSRGLSSIPGGNYIYQSQKGGPSDNDNVTCVTGSQKPIDLAIWREILEQPTRGFHSSVSSPESLTALQSASTGIVLGEEDLTRGQHLTGGSVLKEGVQNLEPVHSNWQTSFGDNSVQLPTWSMDQSSNLDWAYDLGMTMFEPKIHDMDLRNAPELFTTHPILQSEQNNHQIQFTNYEPQFSIKSNSKTDMPIEGNSNYALTLKKSLLDGEQSLKKVDSFSRWATKELGDVDDLHLQSLSGISWSTDECGNVVDDSSLSPSISQDQLYSILDFSPKWAYTDSETEVLIIGTFFKSLPEVTKCDWSCMFGELEVPAEVLANGVLCCRTPPHAVGQIPFYVTCSNRLACSEVREFDYRVGSVKDIDIAVIYRGATNEMRLHLQLERLLSLSVTLPSHLESVTVKRELISKIISLKEEEEYYQMVEPVLQKDLSQHEMEHVLKMLVKEKLYSWLLRKLSEAGKGPSILDDDGQGVIHLAAALGYDWAIKPILTAEISINFRDVNGWTALHWAAFCGREQTVAFLVSLGADPGALTDPSPEFPLGRTPADLASGKGHKGISGFLAEGSLTSYLTSLTVNDKKEGGTVEVSGMKAVQTVSERTATPVNYSDAADALSLKDSLNAICNATQAADRIHQMFRMHSFERRKITEYDDDNGRLSDGRALSIVSAKSRKPKQSDGLAHAAATQIQKKFRGWKKRKEFLITRQRIVKIQAHVRGHQVRKQYRTIIRSVGILEKVILRWRREGIGLRGFRQDAHKDSNPQSAPSKEDDYDFLKEGRKQTEERLQKALSRVKSMVQYPEGQAQYRRLQTVVEGFRETKACNMVLSSSEETVDGDEDVFKIGTLLDDEMLLDDDAFMSIAFE